MLLEKDQILAEVILLKRKRIKVLLKGHPTDCMQQAHALCRSHFQGAWHFTSIKTKAPMDPDKKSDSTWLFKITAELK